MTQGRPTLSSFPGGRDLPDNGNGEGHPFRYDDEDGGLIPVILDANGGGQVTSQNFVLMVATSSPPVFTGSTFATAVVGVPFTFTVTTIGTSTAALSLSGSLPPPISPSWTTVTARRRLLEIPRPTAVKAVTRSPLRPRALLWLNDANVRLVRFGAGAAGVRRAQTRPLRSPVRRSASRWRQPPHPAPALSLAGLLPPTLAFTDNGDGTATIAGDPVEH